MKKNKASKIQCGIKITLIFEKHPTGKEGVRKETNTPYGIYTQ